MRRRDTIVGGAGIAAAAAEALSAALAGPRGPEVPRHPRELRDMARVEGRAPAVRDWEFRRARGRRPA